MSICRRCIRKTGGRRCVHSRKSADRSSLGHKSLTLALKANCVECPRSAGSAMLQCNSKLGCTESCMAMRTRVSLDHGAISPMYTVLSDDADAMMGWSGWKTASFTEPECPGRRYTSLSSCTSHIQTILSPLPAVTRFPSDDHAHLSRCFSKVC